VREAEVAGVNEARRAIVTAELYRLLVETVSDHAIFALDAQGRVITWNPGARRFKGYAAEEILGCHFSTFYPPEDIASGKPRWELEVATRDGRVEDEGWRVRKDGSRFWASVVITALRDHTGQLIGFAKVTRDLTQRREMEESLRASQERLRLLVGTVKDYVIIMLDPEGHVTSWNEGAERIKGYQASEILGRHFSLFYPPEAVAARWPERELEIAARDGRFEDEGWRVRKDGTRFWGNLVLTALRDDQGRLVGYAKITRDLTARREAEEQARRLAAEQAALAEATRHAEELRVALERVEAARAAEAEAYRSLDQFAYVASHDLKAPLRGIGNLATWLQEDVGDRLGAQAAEHLQLIQGRVARMMGLIDGILAYSRAGRVRSAVERVDTGALVNEAILLLGPPREARIEVAAGMPAVEAERVPLQQVFLNLVGNAVKYTCAERPDAVIRVSYRDAGELWEFQIEDNGPGIAPEFHERIWGVFQTLAPRDKVEGTGIGLAVVRKIVETRGGAVAVDSDLGRGARFRFTWPKAQRAGDSA
jgi:PAS domain S-box-containing protein